MKTELCIYLDDTSKIASGPFTNPDEANEEYDRLIAAHPDWNGRLHKGVRMVSPWCECAEEGMK